MPNYHVPAFYFLRWRFHHQFKISHHGDLKNSPTKSYPHSCSKILPFIFLIASLLILFSQILQADYNLGLGKCTAAGGGAIYGKQFWELRPAMQGILVHNYIFDVWADMGYLALGASVDANMKARIRPDFYFDGVIRDIKPLALGKTRAEVVQQYRDQFKKQEWIRFWFLPDTLEISSSDSQEVITFPKNLMTVRTENMKFDGQKLISDFTPHPASPQGRFAAHFNQHVDEFAAEIPVFRELQEVTKIVALFRWIFDQQLTIDMGYFQESEVRNFPYPKYKPLIRSAKTTTSKRVQGNYLVTEELTSILVGGVDLQDVKFKQVPANMHEELVNAILQDPDNIPFRYGDVLCLRRFFATASIPNMELRKTLYESCRNLMPEEVRQNIKLATDHYGKVILYTDANEITYYFEYDELGRMTAVNGWDQPISYQYSYKDGKIQFQYELYPGTNHYIKRFEYVGETDQIKRIEILKNGEREHVFSVQVQEKDVLVERECK